MNKFYLFTLILFCFGCSNSEERKEDELPIKTIQQENIETYDKEIETTEIKVDEDVDSLLIDLGFLKVQIPEISAYNKGEVGNKDTIDIYLELTIGSLDSQFVILTPYEDVLIDSLSIFESYRTTVSVMDEGPHIELYEWQGFESEWKLLEKVSNNIYQTRTLTRLESEKFPDFTREELVQAVIKQGGERWGKLISNPQYGKWTEQFWIGVGVRRIKVEGILSTGESFCKVINLYPPMGC